MDCVAGKQWRGNAAMRMPANIISHSKEPAASLSNANGGHAIHPGPPFRRDPGPGFLVAPFERKTLTGTGLRRGRSAD